MVEKIKFRRRSASLAFAFLQILLVSLAAQASPPKRAIVIINGQVDSQRPQQLEKLLCAALEHQTQSQVISHDAAIAALSQNPVLEKKRREAATDLAEAKILAANMRLLEALNKLEQAQKSALAGLAALLEPQLLSDIYFEQGVNLLLTKPEEGQTYLTKSFAWWPARKIDEKNVSPKHYPQLSAAQKRALDEPPYLLTDEEASLAAQTLMIESLLVVSTRRMGFQDNIEFRHYFVPQQKYQMQAKLAWPAEESADQFKPQVEKIVEQFFAEHGKHNSNGSFRKPAIWACAGVSVASLLAGIALNFSGRGKVREAEDLSSQTPLVEYQPRISDLEDSGRQQQTTSVVFFSLSAAAAAASVALWLWPSDSEQPSTSNTVRFGPGPGWAGVSMGVDY